MHEELSDKIKYDPSDIRQFFSDLNIQLHCCRYWMLTEWNCFKMAFPFWRFYYNTIGSANVNYKGNSTQLTPDIFVIIPPNTSFSTSLKSTNENSSKESILGKRISNLEEIHLHEKMLSADHLFIHFNLGLPYDLLRPGIYTFPVTSFTNDMVNEIKAFSMTGTTTFSFRICCIIHSLLFFLIQKIPQDSWETLVLDQRITNIMTYIESHLHEPLTNAELSEKVRMAKNSFARLFKVNTNTTVQYYIKKKRIEKSLILLHHSNFSVEEIANQCGFFDRHHFSKVFKEQMQMSPVFYKRHLTF